EKSNKSARQQLRTEINAEARELFGRNKGQLSSMEELDTVLSFFAHDLNTRFSGMGVYIDRVSALLRDKLAKSINKSAEAQIDAGAKELLARNKGQLSSMEELETVLTFFAHDLKSRFSGMGTHIDRVSAVLRDKLTKSIEERVAAEDKARIQQLARDRKLNQASAKLLANQVKQFENSFISDNAKGTSFSNLGLVIDKFSSSLYNRFGDLGDAAKEAADIVRNKLVKILEVRAAAETRDESARAAAAQKLANAEAKRLANLNARLKTKDGRFAFDAGDIDKDKLRKTLENQFGISGNRLKEAVDVFIGEFIRVRDKQIEEIAKSAEQESRQRIKLANEFA